MNDLQLGETQLCLVCDQVKPLEQGEAIVRYASFIEFTCYECMNNKHEDIHLAMMEDFSNVISKYLPNFDNNLTDETWKLLQLFTDEAIHQLKKEIK